MDGPAAQTSRAGPGRGVLALERRARRRAPCRAGARAPRARRAGGGARVPRGARSAHDAGAFAGIDDAVALDPRATSRGGSRITVHGDYDVDGVVLDRDPRARAARARRATSTGSCRAAPRTATAWRRDGRAARRARHAPARDRRLRDHRRRRGRRRARAPGSTSSSPTTTSRAPTARCPTRRSSTRALGGYPCPDLCAAGVAYKLARRAARRRRAAIPRAADDDLDLVALATVADCVPLHGENRRLVRDGPARARRDAAGPGLRALMRVARVDPSGARRARGRLPPRAADQRRRAACTAPTPASSCC